LFFSALLPILIAPTASSWFGDVVSVVAWIVFVVDFYVHQRRLVTYLGTARGWIDITIVVITAPWFLIPGASTGSVVVVVRLARFARIVVASRGMRHLFERIGRVAGVAAGVVLVSSFVVYGAEHGHNPEFARFTDALW
jgi:voltage-gated potassium channel